VEINNSCIIRYTICTCDKSLCHNIYIDIVYSHVSYIYIASYCITFEVEVCLLQFDIFSKENECNKY